jgi:site-specific DNA-methyltransferase (adenine-specific)
MPSNPLPFRRRRGASSPGVLFRHRYGDLVLSDGLAFLRALRDDSADLVFLDPPFNLGKRYGRKKGSADKLGDDEYYAYLWQVVHRAAKVLKPGGALFVYHLPRWAVRIAGSLEGVLDLRHWIAVSMKNGFARGRTLYPAHYALLYLTKGEPAIFRRPKIPAARCPHCDCMTKDYGGYQRFVADGVNLSDVWDDLSPVRHRKHKRRFSNELNAQIPARVLAIAGRPGGLFVDPFAGTGTALLMAAEAGMRFVASDLEREHFGLIRRRLRAAGSLKGGDSGG